MTVQLAQGISEKGAEKYLKYDELLKRMIQKVAECCTSRSRSLVLLFCADGAYNIDCWQMVEVKCVKRLIKYFAPDTEVESRLFSFRDSNAAQNLEEADVFYFKGWGGDVREMQNIFGRDQHVTPEIQQVVQLFQNRILFSDTSRCSLLTFMVCGGAILMGTHYPNQNQIVTLKLLGDVVVKYHACETTANINVTTEDHAIQLVPGVANIMWFEHGHLDVSCAIVAKKDFESYYVFAKESEHHIRTVMRSQALKWRIYLWGGKCWGCRADGHTCSRDTIDSLFYYIKRSEPHGDSLSQDVFLQSAAANYRSAAA